MHKYTTFMNKQTGVIHKQEWLIYAVCGTFLYILTKRKMHKIDRNVHKCYDIHAQAGRGLQGYFDKCIPYAIGRAG